MDLETFKRNKQKPKEQRARVFKRILCTVVLVLAMLTLYLFYRVVPEGRDEIVCYHSGSEPCAQDK